MAHEELTEKQIREAREKERQKERDIIENIRIKKEEEFQKTIAFLLVLNFKKTIKLKKIKQRIRPKSVRLKFKNVQKNAVVCGKCAVKSTFNPSMIMYVKFSIHNLEC